MNKSGFYLRLNADMVGSKLINFTFLHFCKLIVAPASYLKVCQKNIKEKMDVAQRDYR